MCLACGEATASFGGHAVSLTERPAHRLCGIVWEGSHAEAEAGAVHATIDRVKAWSDSRRALWKSPIVALSWNDRPAGLRTFVGIACEPGETSPEGFGTVEMPAMRFAGSWHGAGDGDVVSHYGRILSWLRDRGIAWDRERLHQREEYPVDVDLSKPPALRLLLPVVDAD